MCLQVRGSTHMLEQALLKSEVGTQCVGKYQLKEKSYSRHEKRKVTPDRHSENSDSALISAILINEYVNLELNERVEGEAPKRWQLQEHQILFSP